MHNTEYFIGIDGGGTKTIACLLDRRGNVVQRCSAGPTNYLLANENSIISILRDMIIDLCKKQNIPVESTSIGVALSGLGGQTAQIRIKEQLANAVVAQSIQTMSDATAALEGAFPSQSGMILIAGTGSIAFAKDSDNKQYRAGGWGFLIGDEGSGFAIARAGINAALMDWDRRGKKTALRSAFEAYFNVSSIEKAVPIIYAKMATRGALAQSAPIVFEIAEKGDLVAQAIIIDAANALADLIIALAQQCNDSTVNKVALIGNIFKSRQQITPQMEKRWHDTLYNFSIVVPRFSADIGAALLATK